jgi:hypothetical protein
MSGEPCSEYHRGTVLQQRPLLLRLEDPRPWALSLKRSSHRRYPMTIVQVGRDLTKDIDAVLNMFAPDSGFKRVPDSKWLYSGKSFDGAKLGVILATYNESFGNYSLNCEEFDRLLEADEKRKVSTAWVAKVRFDNELNRRIVVEVLDAIEVSKMVSGVEPKKGIYGDFWTLPNSDAEAW